MGSVAWAYHLMTSSIAVHIFRFGLQMGDTGTDTVRNITMDECLPLTFRALQPVNVLIYST